MGKAKKILTIILNVVLWLFVAFAVLITVLVFTSNKSSDGIASLFGYSPVSILSDSMKPEFAKGDLVFSKVLTNAEKKNCKVDDVISFYVDLDGDGTMEINTHRIVSVNGDNDSITYTTKGDNNPTNDSNSVAFDKVLAKYTGKKVAKLGSFLQFLNTKKGFFFIIVLPLILFFLYELYAFVRTLIDVKTEKQKAEFVESEEEIKKRAVEEYLRQQATGKSTEETNMNDVETCSAVEAVVASETNAEVDEDTKTVGETIEASDKE